MIVVEQQKKFPVIYGKGNGGGKPLKMGDYIKGGIKNIIIVFGCHT